MGLNLSKAALPALFGHKTPSFWWASKTVILPFVVLQKNRWNDFEPCFKAKGAASS